MQPSCLPSDQAIEKSNLLLKLGAIVDRVPPAPIVEKDNFVNRARALAKTHTASSGLEPTSEDDLPTDESMTRGRGFFADQFENEANWRAHYDGTGPELYAQCDGRIDAFVAGAGTGGTISGVARFLKPLLPKLEVVLADPQGSGLFNRVVYGVMFDVKEREGTRRRRQVDTIVEGIGINRVTANFEAGKELVDDAVRVTDAQALAMARWLVEKDGIFIGSSSAVNCEFFAHLYLTSPADRKLQALLLSRQQGGLALDLESSQYFPTLGHGIYLDSGPRLETSVGPQTQSSRM